ncbi:hypothetical protein K431DRAFT_311773 [Polychaeton citri CBS 116435]|uniref:Uncharacterized protein n=1 Tax=Polychaeton citri CBS 116435 TaxID=1314669 RepID=A0A9P4UR82_9PEZI|nr:hypothetical protein K431DRAFT_311773 [Polychaeton citri CBS 116435]
MSKEAAARAAMLLDLGISRRDELSTPVESEGAFLEPSKRQIAQQQAERRRKIESSGNVVLAAWNNKSNFQRDEVAEQLPDMAQGQLHRANLSIRAGRANNYNLQGSRRPSDLADLTAGGEERMKWLSEKNASSRSKQSTSRPVPRTMRAGFRVSSNAGPLLDSKSTSHTRALSPRLAGTKRYFKGREITLSPGRLTPPSSVRGDDKLTVPAALEEGNATSAVKLLPDASQLISGTPGSFVRLASAIKSAKPSTSSSIAPSDTTVDTPLGSVAISPGHIRPDLDWNAWATNLSADRCSPFAKMQAVGYALNPSGEEDFNKAHPERRDLNKTAKEKLTIYINFLATFAPDHRLVEQFEARWFQCKSRLAAAREQWKSKRAVAAECEVKAPFKSTTSPATTVTQQSSTATMASSTRLSSSNPQSEPNSQHPFPATTTKAPILITAALISERSTESRSRSESAAIAAKLPISKPDIIDPVDSHNTALPESMCASFNPLLASNPMSPLNTIAEPLISIASSSDMPTRESSVRVDGASTYTLTRTEPAGGVITAVVHNASGEPDNPIRFTTYLPVQIMVDIKPLFLGNSGRTHPLSPGDLKRIFEPALEMMATADGQFKQ